MKNYGLVSIVTPSFNASAYIKDTIEAIRSQSYQNWELLITDDCSTDDSVDIIEEYVTQDARIKFLKMEINSGAGKCRNKSIEAAKGRYIAFCDSDDVWMPNKLEKQLAFMEEKDCALVYSSYMQMDEQQHVYGVVICKKEETLKSMIKDCGIGCLTAMYDTVKVGKVYMSALRKRQDWGLWLTLLMKCGVAYGVKEPLAYYRVRRESISANKWALVKHNISVYRQILNYSTIRAYLTFFFIFLPNYAMKKVRVMINSM